MHTSSDNAIDVEDLTVAFGPRVVIDHLNMSVRTGEILGLVGGSGSGKSVLMRSIIGLLPKTSGRIRTLGLDRNQASEEDLRAGGRRWGVLFQQGALFSSLSALENVMFPMREHLRLPEPLMRSIACAKLEMVGLSAEDGEKMPAALSGGMTKRVGLARALALDPEIVFLDEPTSGLDPIAAGDFDDLIRTLQRTLGLTVFMVTHDLQSLECVCDRIAALAHGRILAIGTLAEMRAVREPWMQAYFHARHRAQPQDAGPAQLSGER
jgi:phospholipid/cholesterol/gamma-HCH transport system ATP-binding protein